MRNLITFRDDVLIQLWITELRDEKTSNQRFRQLVGLITARMFPYAFSELGKEVERVTVQTPLESTHGVVMTGYFGLVAILRAGARMADTIQEIFPKTRRYDIKIHRDESNDAKPQLDWHKFPDNLPPWCFLVDPALATGGSAIMAINQMKACGALRVGLFVIIGCPEGVSAVHEAHPDVDIYAATVDRQLNDKKYILPGFGDAGDRLVV